MKCMHCVNKASREDKMGRRLCEHHYSEVFTKDVNGKVFEAFCLLGSLAGVMVIVGLAIMMNK
jgi:hypothetical protein